MAGQRIVEGIFAINKPALKTSAQVLRDLQTHFNSSALFAPWLAEASRLRDQESRNQKNRRRKHRRLEVKVGHGGTLDPMATGVLIVGVGKGTKALASFLACTKTYETTVLFGAASDTYDVTGRLLGRASTANVTREAVEKALEKFKGDIMQKPPIYSALRVQGKRLYEYAREGKVPPVEIEERPLRVEDIGVLEWLEPGGHAYRLPREEAEREEKIVAGKLVDIGGELSEEEEGGLKRKREDGEDGNEGGLKEEPPAKKIVAAESDAEIQEEGSTAAAVVDALVATGHEPRPANPSSPKAGKRLNKYSASKDEECLSTENKVGDPVPAAKVSVTSSSGFYVRSLCHDLGRAVGSLGMMATLVRKRQGDFELGKNVLEYEDLAKGEDVWGPKVDAMLTQWTSDQDASDG